MLGNLIEISYPVFLKKRGSEKKRGQYPSFSAGVKFRTRWTLRWS